MSELPPDVIQFLKAHVQSDVAYNLLLKYGDEETKHWARRKMAIMYFEDDGDMVGLDRQTYEEIERVPPCGMESSTIARCRSPRRSCG